MQLNLQQPVTKDKHSHIFNGQSKQLVA